MSRRAVIELGRRRHRAAAAALRRRGRRPLGRGLPHHIVRRRVRSSTRQIPGVQFRRSGSRGSAQKLVPARPPVELEGERLEHGSGKGLAACTALRVRAPPAPLHLTRHAGNEAVDQVRGPTVTPAAADGAAAPAANRRDGRRTGCEDRRCLSSSAVG